MVLVVISLVAMVQELTMVLMLGQLAAATDVGDPGVHLESVQPPFEAAWISLDRREPAAQGQHQAVAEALQCQIQRVIQ